MSNVEEKVPNIGDYKDVLVIEVLVSVGDKIKRDQNLIVVKIDKASMENPATSAGIVKALNVQIGDKVSEGSIIQRPEHFRHWGYRGTAHARPQSRP